MGAHDDLLAAQGAGRRAQDEVEGVLGVDGETADLGAVHLEGPGDVAGLLAVAVQRQGDEVGGGQVDGVPLEDDRGLGGIAAAQDGRAGLGGAKGREDAVLEGGESLVRLGLGRVVAGDGDVHDGARDDIGWQEDGGELDLRCSASAPGLMGWDESAQVWAGGEHVVVAYFHTRRLSGVRSTVTPASTLPTVRDTSMLADTWRAMFERCRWSNWAGYLIFFLRVLLE